MDLNGGGDHFRAEIVSPAFAGLCRIEQHKLVYAVFGAEIGGPIHALSLEASRVSDRAKKTPSATPSRRRSTSTKSSSS